MLLHDAIAWDGLADHVRLFFLFAAIK